MTRNATTLRRTTLAALAAAATLGLSACGDEAADPVADAGVAGDASEETAEEVAEEPADESAEEEQGEALEEPVAATPFDGPYDARFYDDLTSYDIQQVVVDASIEEVIEDRAFTISDPEGTVDATLVIEGEENPGTEAGQAVQINGIVRQSLDVAAVEDDLGIDLDDQALSEWVGEPFIISDQVDPAPVS